MPTNKPGVYAIRRNRIQWLERMALNATKGYEAAPAAYCNLPREAIRVEDRTHADAIAIDYAHKHPGDRFEVWNIETMRQLTVVQISPDLK